MRRAAALLAAAVLAPFAGAAPPTGKALSDLLEQHNRGVAAMERHQFAEAAAAFEKVTKAAPDWPVGHVNLGLAYMNGAKEYPKAEAAFRKALQIEPRNPHAHFSLGVMLESLDRKDEALSHLKAAAEVVPEDPDVHFKLGRVAEATGDAAAAEASYRRAVELSPEFASAHYALGLLEVRSGRKEAGKKRLDLFEKLRVSKEAKAWGLKYTEMGRYADVIRLGAPGSASAPAAAAPAISFQDVSAKGLAPGAPSLAAADVDGDGDVDVVAGGRLLRNDGGKLVDGGAAGDDGPSWLTDVDNDGLLDVVQIGKLRKRTGSAWAAAAALPMPGQPASLTVAEADADGDLDIVVAGKPSILLVNNRDGTFREAASDPPLATQATAALAFDADGDVDTDLALLGPSSALLRNDRLWRFHPEPLPAPPSTVAAAAADVDGDGDMDLATAGASGIFLFVNQGALRFAPSAASVASGKYVWVAVADMDRDGRVDLVAARTEPKPAIVVLAGDGRGAFAPPLEAALAEAPTTAVLLDVDRDGDLDAAVASAAGVRLLLSKGAEKQRGLAVTLQGPERAGEARSNRFGVGARVEVKSGGNVLTLERSTGCGPSMTLGPLHFGLGTASKADYVRVVWPDGVIQSEPETPAGDLALPEVQRKAGSCPTLFAWDGQRFAFVADFLGGGGVGFYVGPDIYGPPDPTESVALPALAPRNGLLEIRILEPLEEISYLDLVELLVVEHPRDVTIYPDERFAVAEPMPTGRPLAVRDRLVPVEARDETGRDVTELVRDVDRRYVAPRAEDLHFLGLASDTTLALRFAEALPPDGYLFLHGWIEYGYSGTVFAAAQAGRTGVSPTLDYLDPTTGRWVEAAVMGYPAGTPRMMTYPLSGSLPAGVTEIRVRTNMTIFWDQAFVARDVAGSAGLRQHLLPPRTATLAFRGYPREFSPDGAEPLSYDYENADPTRGFKRPAGSYTRFGDVRELLAATDDMFAIVGPGEEVALSFSAAPPPGPDRAHTYILLSDGFCKDMDLYTAHPDTVDPLPFHAMSGYPYPPSERYPDGEPHRLYRERYNTREVPRLPPAPSPEERP